MNAMLKVHPSNEQQAAAWDGDAGAYWSTHHVHYERGLAAYQPRFLAAAAIAPRDRVLDIGCGNGLTTREAAREAAEGFAVGVDLSGAMLERARSLAAAEGLTNVSFVHADAQVHEFEPAAFDVAISRTAAMFFGDPVAALANIRHALRRGGRLVLLTWQGIESNEWLSCIRSALAAGRSLPAPPADAPGPFALSVPDRVRSVVRDAGYADVTLDDLREPMWFGADADDAFGFLAGQFGWLLEDLDAARRESALEALLAMLREHETADGVTFRSAAWLTTARVP